MKFVREGIIKYPISLIEMDIAVEMVLNGCEECVFILEHEAMYSAGKSFEQKDFVSESKLPIYYAKRGGRVTIHSPGQIVLYPILNLKKRQITVKDYVNTLEKWIITVLQKFNVNGSKDKEGMGVWANGAKIGFVGIRIEKGISSHGICINISNDLTLFDSIIPCGIDGVQITSLEKILDQKISLKEVRDTFIETSPL
jgi:lipoyl(octanoyl) transferase